MSNYKNDNKTCLFIVNQSIGLMSWVSVRQWSGRPGFNSRSSPTKDSKMLLDAHHYKVKINGKVEQSRERSSALPYTLV